MKVWLRLASLFLVLCLPISVGAQSKKSVDLFKQGRTLERQGKYEQALDQYRKSIIVDPENVDAYLAMGRLHERKGNLDGAVIAYQQALRVNNKDARTHASLGHVYLEQREDSRARSHFKKALKVDPTSKEARIGMAYVYQRKGKIDDAARALESLKAEYPKNSEVRASLGYVYLQAEQIDLSVPEYRRATELNPRKASYWFGLGEALGKQGNEKGSAAAYKKGLARAKGKRDQFMGRVALGRSLSAQNRKTRKHWVNLKRLQFFDLLRAWGIANRQGSSSSKKSGPKLRSTVDKPLRRIPMMEWRISIWVKP